MSMEEEAARQAAANAPAPSSPGATSAPIAAAVAAAVAAVPDGGAAVQHPSGPAAVATATTADEGDEALLQQALALSAEGHGGAPDVEMTEEQDGDENLTEEEMIARAIEMSMRPEPESEEKKK
jgi:26S proteasome regulatory subunit N10